LSEVYCKKFETWSDKVGKAMPYSAEKREDVGDIKKDVSLQ
jgi:hypothetical protein